LASFAVEIIGALVGASNGVSDISGLLVFAGGYGWLAMLAIVLGGMAANALNIYTNALSALVLDLKAKRTTMVVAGGAIGLALTLVWGMTFESFFENFLLVLDYWITPWLAIILVDFYLSKRTGVAGTEEATSFDFGAFGVYLFSIVVSIPFMVPPTSPGFPVGALSGWFGGADFSYFVSFAIAGILTLALRKRERTGPNRHN
jgi:NCS1 family nucleobase:cation symporter-1